MAQRGVRLAEPAPERGRLIVTRPSPETPDGQLVGRVIAMPADTNPEGDIFGGWLLAQMDLAGSTPAFDLAQVGRDLLIFVEVLLDRTTGDVFDAFADAVRAPGYREDDRLAEVLADAAERPAQVDLDRIWADRSAQFLFDALCGPLDALTERSAERTTDRLERRNRGGEHVLGVVLEVFTRVVGDLEGLLAGVGLGPPRRSASARAAAARRRGHPRHLRRRLRVADRPPLRLSA